MLITTILAMHTELTGCLSTFLSATFPVWKINDENQFSGIMKLHYFCIPDFYKMIAKIFTFLALASSNILLYYFLILLGPEPDYKLLFVLVRAILVTSVLMQVLTACGFFKNQKLWTW